MTYKQLSFLGAMVLAVMCTVPAGASPSTTPPQPQKNWKEKIKEPFQSQQQRDRNRDPSPHAKRIDCDYCYDLTKLCPGSSSFNSQQLQDEINWCEAKCGKEAYQNRSKGRKEKAENFSRIKSLCENIVQEKKKKEPIEVKIQDVEIASVKELLPKLAELGVKVEESAIYFDFDDTLARHLFVYQNQEYSYLSSLDLIRTYGAEYTKALNQLGINPLTQSVAQPNATLLKLFEAGEATRKYEVLDPSAKEVIIKLKNDAWATGVISAKPYDPNKQGVLDAVGFNQTDYVGEEGENKATLIGEALLFKESKDEKPLSAIILVDNSKDSALKGFKENMQSIINDKLRTKTMGRTLKVIAVHHTFFKEGLVENLVEEIPHYWRKVLGHENLPETNPKGSAEKDKKQLYRSLSEIN